MEFGTKVKCDIYDIRMIDYLIEHATGHWQFEYKDGKLTFYFESWYDAIKFNTEFMTLTKKP